MTTPDDEGFEALLKPIQDLTRNWEVDLCLHLEEYISYIRQICGDNIPDMNFAQAAVLVQNSANIYSKKVDFLFTTVLQLLDTLSKKQKEAKNKENQDNDPSQPGARRRRVAAVLDYEEFECFDEVCSDKPLVLNLEKEKQKLADKKKPKIVLNAAIKAKAKEKTSCTVFNCASDIMGKKEEFRLNWRVCSAGTLHEEFVLNTSIFSSMEPIEFSICRNDGSIAPDNCLNDSGDSGIDALPDNDIEAPPPPASLENPMDHIDREENINGNPCAREKTTKMAIKDIIVSEWQPNDLNLNLPEKSIKKKKVIKIPPELDTESKKRKNAVNEIGYSYTPTDVLFDKFKNTSFFRDIDFTYQAKTALNYRRQLLLNHRAKYQAYLETELCQEEIEDFHGFYNDNDSDGEHNFEGFPEASNNKAGTNGDFPPDDIVPELNLLTDDVCVDEDPLSSKEGTSNEPGWKGDDGNTYHNEAMKTLEAYRSRKIDHGRMSDMARRVEEWHQKILPKLEAAEERSSFDIHEYGTKVLNTFSDQIGYVKSFEEIVAGQSQEEVARYFLASLVLANQYNVEISETQAGDLNVDCVQLKLLSVTRHQDELDDNLRQTSDK